MEWSEYLTALNFWSCICVPLLNALWRSLTGQSLFHRISREECCFSFWVWSTPLPGPVWNVFFHCNAILINNRSFLYYFFVNYLMLSILSIYCQYIPTIFIVLTNVFRSVWGLCLNGHVWARCPQKMLWGLNLRCNLYLGRDLRAYVPLTHLCLKNKGVICEFMNLNLA